MEYRLGDNLPARDNAGHDVSAIWEDIESITEFQNNPDKDFAIIKAGGSKYKINMNIIRGLGAGDILALNQSNELI